MDALQALNPGLDVSDPEALARGVTLTIPCPGVAVAR